MKKAVDFTTFPVRAVMPFRVGQHSRWGMTSRASERFDYVARHVEGYTLDVGCGPYNRFVREYLQGYGFGVDVHPYEGLERGQVVDDLTSFPFEDCSFDSATLIATLHHIPKSQRDPELAEIYRVLRPGGRLVATMTSPVAATLVHRVTRAHAKVWGTDYDIDLLREMHEEEEDYVTEAELRERLHRAGFVDVVKKPFLTQWGLNRLFIGLKGK